MSNEILLVIDIFVCFAGTMIFFKLLGRYGLYAWIAIAIIIANIESAKAIELFGATVTLGTPMFATMFLATDILNERYGYRESKIGVNIALAAGIAAPLILQLDVLFEPGSADIAQESFEIIFSLSGRMFIASILMMYISNRFDIWLFQKLKEKKPEFLWLRNNVATITAQVMENVALYILAFAGVYDWPVIWQIILVTSILEIIIALADTPFLYLSKKIKVLTDEKE